MKKMLPMISMLFLLTGCNEEVKTVDFYMQNPSELDKKVAECRNNPGGARLDNNCQNALEAESRLMFNPNATGMPTIK